MEHDGRAVTLLTVEGWQMDIPDSLKYDCIKKLETTEFVPRLNTKETQ